MKQFLISTLVLLFILCTGCSKINDGTGQRLLITAVTEAESSITINVEELNGNFDENLRFHNVKDVTITLDGKSYPLEDAIAEGLITVEEIEAYARIDARNGFCEEIAASSRGVSHFIYRYKGICDLYFTHDVYETPDGSNPITTCFAVSNNNGMDNSFYFNGSTMLNVQEQNYPADMEDWKLKFEISDVSPTGFTLNIRQTDSPIKQYRSHHVGELQLTGFELFCLDNPADSYLYSFNSEECVIESGVTKAYRINFSDAENFPAELPSGNYRIYLDIQDVFEEADVHPLMKDYYQSQGYWISFEIP